MLYSNFKLSHNFCHAPFLLVDGFPNYHQLTTSQFTSLTTCTHPPRAFRNFFRTYLFGQIVRLLYGTLLVVFNLMKDLLLHINPRI